MSHKIRTGTAVVERQIVVQNADEEEKCEEDVARCGDDDENRDATQSAHEQKLKSIWQHHVDIVDILRHSRQNPPGRRLLEKQIGCEKDRVN